MYCESPEFMTVLHPTSYEDWILTTSQKKIKSMVFSLSEPSDLLSKTKNTAEVFRRQKNGM